MIVKLSPLLFTDAIHFDKIDNLMDFFICNRYQVYIDDPDIIDSEWSKEVRQTKIDFVKEAIVLSANKKNFDITLCNENDIGNKTYSLDDGTIFLNNETLIFLENAYYDQNFIRGIISKFENGSKALSFYKKRWVTFKNCGGKNGAKNQINEELKRYRDETLENHHYIKAIVILDSDKTHPKDIKDISDLEKYCKEKGVILHILEKREMENYLPITILEKEEDIDKKIISSLKEFSPEQYDHYDLEKGYNVNSKSKLHTFYENVSEENYKTLIKGLDNPSFRTKQKLPHLFLLDNLTREMLLERCAHQQKPREIEEIINKINGLL